MLTLFKLVPVEGDHRALYFEVKPTWWLYVRALAFTKARRAKVEAEFKKVMSESRPFNEPVYLPMRKRPELERRGYL